MVSLHIPNHFVNPMKSTPPKVLNYINSYYWSFSWAAHVSSHRSAAQWAVIPQHFSSADRRSVRHPHWFRLSSASVWALAHFCCTLGPFAWHCLLCVGWVFAVQGVGVWFVPHWCFWLVQQIPEWRKRGTCIFYCFFFFCSHYSPPMLAPNPPNRTHSRLPVPDVRFSRLWEYPAPFGCYLRVLWDLGLLGSYCVLWAYSSSSLLRYCRCNS